MKSIYDIQHAVEQFAQERDWDKFHSPKNLAMALSIEAAELMEHFQWLTEDQSKTLDTETREKVRKEIADIQVYLSRIADKLNIDIYQAVSDKLEENRAKYPADKVYGSAKKYSAYQDNEEQE